MSTNTGHRRRRADSARLDRRLTLTIDADMRARLDDAAGKFGVTTASVVRLALDAGLPAALKRLRRERGRRTDRLSAPEADS